jgi:hypothetical protein
MFGGLYVLVGASVLLVDLDRFGNVPVIGPALDAPAWGWAWIAGGLVALGTVTTSRPGVHRYGPAFAALLVPSGLWVVFYAASMITYLATGTGRLAAIGGVLAYAFIWSVVLLTAGWPDAPLGRRAQMER